VGSQSKIGTLRVRVSSMTLGSSSLGLWTEAKKGVK